MVMAVKRSLCFGGHTETDHNYHARKEKVFIGMMTDQSNPANQSNSVSRYVHTLHLSEKNRKYSTISSLNCNTPIVIT